MEKNGLARMSRVLVLMYHGIYDSREEYKMLPAEEVPYAISKSTFESHLRMFSASGIQVINHADLVSEADALNSSHGLLITFDDGQKGWIDYALPSLRKYGYQATFFVTSDLIGSLPHYCSWADIKKLSEAGMNVQSHGQTHRFLSDLTEKECGAEYRNSKRAIEKVTGKPVDTISFPGGRYRKRDIEIGRRCGYRYFHTSRLGLNTAGHNIVEVKRFAIRAKTSLYELKDIAKQDKVALMRHYLKAGIKTVVRRTLGNVAYDMLYRQYSS